MNMEDLSMQKCRNVAEIPLKIDRNLFKQTEPLLPHLYLFLQQ